MHTTNNGEGSYGYSYVVTVELGNGKKKEEKFNFWFKAPDQRDLAMKASKRTAKNSSGWKKIGR